MSKDRLYLITFTCITIIYSIIAVLAYNYLVKESSLKLLDIHLELNKKESKTLSKILGQQLDSFPKKEFSINMIQSSIEGTENNSSFLTIYDWSGKIIAHPDIKIVGTLAESDNAYVSSVKDNLSAEAFYDRIFDDIAKGNNAPKVVALYPIINSDLILASNININYINSQLNKYKTQYRITLLIMGFVLVLTTVIILRLLSSKYEKSIELKKEKLEDEIINLSKLNRDIISYQEKVNNEPKENDIDSNLTKNRILTYIRNELVPILTEEIAYIYTENTITYVMGYSGKHTTTNVSLDELFSQLDSSHFFRANRQFIISITSIKRIVKYGNNQLKILVKPTTETNIIISKNRAAQFKKWLNT